MAAAVTQPTITANAALGATNNTMLYYQTTKPEDRSLKKATIYAIGRGLTGGAASKADTIKGVAVITGIGYGGTQFTAEGYVDPITTATATTVGAYGKYVGNFGCGMFCQNSIVTPIGNTATTIVDKAEIDKKIGTRIDLRPANNTTQQTQKPTIKRTMPLISCKKVVDGFCVSYQ